MQSWRYFQVYGLVEFRLSNLSDPEIAVVRRYLGTLTALEVAVPAASDNLDTEQASMWIRNKVNSPTAYGFSTVEATALRVSRCRIGTCPFRWHDFPGCLIDEWAQTTRSSLPGFGNIGPTCRAVSRCVPAHRS